MKTEKTEIEKGIQMIDFNRPALTGKEFDYIRDAAQRGKLCGDGEYTKRCSRWMEENFHVKHVMLTTGTYPTCLRPPYGAWKKDLELPVTMLPVFWDVDTLDWQSQNPESILDIVRKNVQDGSIILMHDSYDSSVRAALAITDELTEKGYDFVTADQLLDP